MQRSIFSGDDVQGAHDLATIASLHRTSAACRKCALHAERTSVVFGEGNIDRPRIAFVGEAPGANDDKVGRPFSGTSGHLLDSALDAMGMRRSDVYLCHVVCCRPPSNRPPVKVETVSCKPYLHGQLKAVQPEVIVCLGENAAQALLATPQELASLRGEWHYWRTYPVRVTLSIVTASKTSRARLEMWKDLSRVMERLGIANDHMVGE